MQINWTKQREIWVTEIPGIGRYVIKMIPRTHTWVAFRNGEQTALKENNLEAIKQSVENVINATQHLARRKR